MAHDVQIVTEAELRQIVQLDLTTVDVIEAAFAALARGGVVMPPILKAEWLLPVFMSLPWARTRAAGTRSSLPR